MGDTRRSNCLVFALSRWFSDGGYVLVVWSLYWPGLHFVWTPDGRSFWEFYPIASKRRRWLPPLFFEGEIRRWEPEPAPAMRWPLWLSVATTLMGAVLVLPPLMLWALVTREKG